MKYKVGTCPACGSVIILIHGANVRFNTTCKCGVKFTWEDKDDDAPNLLESEKDIFICAACGQEFEDGDERDEHFMSPQCPAYSVDGVKIDKIIVDGS